MNGKLLFKYKVSYSYWALKPCVMKVTLTPTSQSSSEDRHLKIHHMIFLRISKTVNILGWMYILQILHTKKLKSSSFSSNYQNWWRQISVNSMLIIHDDIKCEGENIYHNLISFLRHLLWELLEKRGERDGAMTMQDHQGEMIYGTNIPLSTGNQNKSRGLRTSFLVILNNELSL